MGVVVDVVRVFTQGEAGGNHLGIVADGLPRAPEEMQEIAADVGYSETIFVLDPDSAPSVRIFTPFAELAFAGHPLVGTAWYLAHHGVRARTIRTLWGDVRCGSVGDRAWVETTLAQPVAEFAGRFPAWLPDPVSLRVVEMAHPYVLWELPAAEDVAGISPQPSDLWIYAFARSGSTVRARFFVENHFEDPATGSAAVALARSFLEDGADSGEVRVFQGEEIGHPSTIHLSWRGRTVRIGGTVHAEASREA